MATAPASLKAVLAANTWTLRAAARAVYRAKADGAEGREEGFELAQWALQTGAGDALAQMSVRFAKGTGELAGLVRQRQDLIARRQGEVRRLDAAAGRADAKAAEDARATVAALDKQLDGIDARLAAEFKEYAELSSPRPLTIAATQALLRPDEALVVFLDVPRFGRLPEESLAWVVTKTDARWLKLSLTPSQIAATVEALRCGLDHTQWRELGSANRCKAALKAEPDEEVVKIANEDVPVQVLPFDAARAHALYKALLGPVEDMIKGKHLLVVPSGPLTSLPFHVLVTEAPKTAIPANLAEYRSVAWLGARQPITVLPSVASLKSAAPVRQSQPCDQALSRRRQSAAGWAQMQAMSKRARACPRQADVPEDAGASVSRWPRGGRWRALPNCSAAPTPTSRRCGSGRRCQRPPMSCARLAAGSACRRAKSCWAPRHRDGAEGPVRDRAASPSTALCTLPRTAR